MIRRLSLLAASALAALASGCSTTSADSQAIGTADGETVSGLVRLVGTTDASGVTVTVGGTGRSAVTDAAGRFSVTGVPEGVYSLSFSRGAYAEVVPGLFVYAGGEPLLLDGLVPLPTIELQRAPRVASARIPDFFRVAGSRAFYGASVGVDIYTRLEAVDAGGTRTVLGDAVNEFIPSADGSVAMYSRSTCDGAYPGCPLDVWAARAAGGPAIRVGGTSDYVPVLLQPFSRDGRRAYVPALQGHSFRIVSTTDGSTLDTLSGWLPYFTPDGSRLVWRDATALYTTVIGSGTITTLATGVCQFQLTPDGTQVLFLRACVTPCQGEVCSAPQGELCSAPAVGGDVRSLAADVRSFVLTPDETKVVYLTEGGDLGAVGVASGAAVPLASGVRAAGAIVSPDGRTVAYSYPDGPGSIRSTVAAVPIVGGDPTIIVSTGAAFELPANPNDLGVRFTADSARLVYTGEPCAALAYGAGAGCALWSAPVAGGAAIRLSDNVSNLASHGSVVAFVEDPNSQGLYEGRLRIAAADGSSARTVAEGVGVSAFGFSPDGATFSFLVYYAFGWSSPVAGGPLGTLYTVPTAGGPGVAQLGSACDGAWGADGTLFATRQGVPDPLGFANGVYVVKP